MRIHSWSLEYRRSWGYMISSGLARPLVERRRDDARGHVLAAHVHEELGADLRLARGQVGEADVLLQERRVGARRHRAHVRVLEEHRIAVASDAAPRDLEPHQLP